MKFLALIGVCLSVVLTACGGSTSGEDTSGAKDVTAKRVPCPQGPTVTMSKAEIAKLPPLEIPKQSEPPPHHLTIVDLRKGHGPPVPKNDLITNREKVFIRYYEVPYPEVVNAPRTGQYGPNKYLLAELTKGQALGLTGMKVGGRRVMILPPKLVYPRWQPSWGYAPYVNVDVVDLLGMEPPPDRRTEYLHRAWHPCYSS